MNLSSSSDSSERANGSEKLKSQPRESLISPEYQQQQEALHESDLYGTAAAQFYTSLSVARLVNEADIQHLLDYGCGHNLSLVKGLQILPDEHRIKRRISYQAYDPGVPRYSKPPLAADLVVCIDVLEHIEPERIDSVLDDIARLALGFVFLTVDTAAALKTLPDGRNAHLIQQPIGWWFSKLDQRWRVKSLLETTEHSFMFIGQARSVIEGTDGRLAR